MPVTEEVLRFRYEQDGDQLLVDGRNKIDSLAASAKVLAGVFKNGAMTKEEYTAAMRKLAAESAKAKVELEALEKIAGTSGAALNRGVAQGLQGSSRALQDFVSASRTGGFTAGLNAITNNVEQVALGIGKAIKLSPELAANVASIGTLGIVGLQLLIPVFKGILDQLGLFKAGLDPLAPEVDRLKDRIKALNETPIKTAEERRELQSLEADLKRLTKAQEAYNEAKGLKSKSERESESAVKDLIAEAPGGAPEVLQSLKREELKKVDKDPALAKARQDLAEAEARLKQLDESDHFPGKSGAVSDTQADIKRLRGLVETRKGEAIQAAEDRVGTLFGNATGKAPAGQVREGVEAFRDALGRAGKGDLADQVATKGPEAMAARAREKELIDKLYDDARQDSERINQALEKARTARKQQVDEIAHGLEKWAEEEILRSGELTVDRVREALESANYDVDDATIADVMKAVGKSYAKKVQQHALGMGGATVEEAQADLKAGLDAKDDKAAAGRQRDANKLLDLTPEQKQWLKESKEQAAKDRAGANAAAGRFGAVMPEVEADLMRSRAVRDEIASAATPRDRDNLIRQARNQGLPVTEEEARTHAAGVAGARLRQAGATDQDGNVLTASQRAAAALEIADRAKVELARKTLQFQQQQLATVAGLQDNVDAMAGQVGQLMQTQQQQIGRNNATRSRLLGRNVR